MKSRIWLILKTELADLALLYSLYTQFPPTNLVHPASVYEAASRESKASA